MKYSRKSTNKRQLKHFFQQVAEKLQILGRRIYIFVRYQGLGQDCGTTSITILERSTLL